MPGDQYGDSEQINAGIYLPSLPDVMFSISSNKDAYADYKKAEFEQMKRYQLSLLARIKDAQKIQGVFYPKRDVLREGKRDVQHWKGEESLIRRPEPKAWLRAKGGTSAPFPFSMQGVIFANSTSPSAKKV